MNNIVIRILIAAGSIVSIGFGIWHFFVPRLWKWYSYIDSRATELIVAVRAINLFFSLCLVLFGLMNVLVVYRERASRYSLIVVVGFTCILWLVRVLMQIIYPQGSMNLLLQYGMLVAFIVVLLCYSVSLILIIKGINA